MLKNNQKNTETRLYFITLIFLLLSINMCERIIKILKCMINFTYYLRENWMFFLNEEIKRL